MRIGIVGSFEFIDKFTEFSDKLSKLGHEPFTSEYIDRFLNKSSEEVEIAKQEFEEDYIMELWNLLQGGDALLVLNYKKREIEGYIGGSTLIEMSFAHVLGMKIYLMNPIPQIQFYYDEMLSMNPIILDGDISKIK